MKNWAVDVTCSMCYEIKAETQEQAEKEAIELFLSDVVKSLDIETESVECANF